MVAVFGKACEKNWSSTKSHNDVHEKLIGYVRSSVQQNEYLRVFQLRVFGSGNQRDSVADLGFTIPRSRNGPTSKSRKREEKLEIVLAPAELVKTSCPSIQVPTIRTI
ncbi:unnamed protein product [Angiostrongylus costaricensis]|uniref:Uncharacterized protein n=1 Tax=Angiostrongylus costaricensis TaxID=334426 RepID=A0A0R3PYQ5_ANGCS|nr:unnamed protein product [Angiostrongylus costaricensis]